ncbi:hypothetical protein HZF24_10360 [Sedimentibacter hydroxybenzoicus DSM 7310]|uniref:Uncharacterized protein n=1 Tax=Sedimentibacter hydroxybenzoicus DSM 7310 TaxID=1123245 RepID=A0A974BKH0_SEDHY|nr:hypothetical protein [Sedimentibacter hydroxybenzoicus]NYB74536.1 hypothetical protein [Sedimentibacter hydroxybenzoicus DSM 7310]
MKRCIISIILIISLLYFISRQIMDFFPAIVFCASFFMSVYVSKFVDLKSSIYKEYNVKLVFNRFGLPRIEYNNVIIQRKIADALIWASKVLVISVLMLFVTVLGFVLKLDLDYLFLLIIIGLIFGSLFHLNDIKKLWKIYFGKRNSLNVKFVKDDVELIETKGVMYLHKDVYFYEEIFNKYSIDDLRRELILIEQEIYDSNKRRFWDKYIVPTLFLLTTSTMGFINALFVKDISMEIYDVNILMMQYSALISIVVIIIIQIFLAKHLLFNPPAKKLILQKLVIEAILAKNMNLN